MGPRQPLRLDAHTYDIPPETEVLGPEWLAAFNVYWRGQCREQSRQVLELLDLATREPTPERSIYLLQKALRLLGVVELSIIRLVLTRYVHFVMHDFAEPAQQVAVQVLATLLSVEETRARGGRPAKRLTEGCGPASLPLRRGEGPGVRDERRSVRGERCGVRDAG